MMIPMQSALADPSMIGIAVLALLAGMVIPLGYGMERLGGFARWVVSFLPYRPPPGQSEEQALQAAVEDGDSPGSDTQADEQDDDQPVREAETPQ